MKRMIDKYGLIIFPSIIFLGLLLVVFIYNQIYLNLPSKISKEMRRLIKEEMGDGYKLIEPCHEETKINAVTVSIENKHFQNKDIFSKISRLKDKIYNFMKEHPQNFSLQPENDEKISNSTQNARGFKLYFEDPSGLPYGGTDVVFCFSNYLDLTKTYDDGFSHMYTGGRRMKRYGFKLSDFRDIRGIKEMFLDELEIDDPDVLGEMDQLKYIYWTGNTASGKELKKAADKYGIVY